MKKTIFTYGLISGCSMAAMYTSLSLQRNSGNSVGAEVLMYAAVVLLFIIVFAGIREIPWHQVHVRVHVNFIMELPY